MWGRLSKGPCPLNRFLIPGCRDSQLLGSAPGGPVPLTASLQWDPQREGSERGHGFKKSGEAAIQEHRACAGPWVVALRAWLHLALTPALTG